LGERAGILASLGLALAPMTGRYAAVLLTETFFTALIVFSIWLWYQDRFVAAGISLGLATLTRGTTLPFIALLAVVAMCFHGSKRRHLVFAVLASVLILTPWIVRNRIQVGRFTVADAGFGVNLLYGTIDLHSGSNRWSQLVEATDSAPRESTQVPSVEGENMARRTALVRIRSHPLVWLKTRARQLPWLVLDTGDYLPVSANTVAFRSALTERRWSTIVLKLGFLFGNVALCALAIGGLWINREKLWKLAPLWIFPAFLIAAHLPMYVEPRYGLPLQPFLWIFAGASIDRCLPSDRL
jgi:4-amino-4-deoxy-L-arabinose transferase-like glycosyltransferase